MCVVAEDGGPVVKEVGGTLEVDGDPDHLLQGRPYRQRRVEPTA